MKAFSSTYLSLLVTSMLLFSSCREDVDKRQLETYEGPVSMGFGVELLHSDSARVRIKLMGEKQLEYKDGNVEFPEGILIHFFDKEGEMTTTIRADKGYFFKKDNLYRGEGDVEVHNLEKEQKLNSEELFWNPRTKKIYTEKFVTVQEKRRIIKGTGLEADEGFNDYILYKIEDSSVPLPGES